MKEGKRFCFKSAAVGRLKRAVGRASEKSFVLLFFKKEALPS
jgi:hypothetical protein